MTPFVVYNDVRRAIAILFPFTRLAFHRWPQSLMRLKCYRHRGLSDYTGIPLENQFYDLKRIRAIDTRFHW